MAGCAAVKCKTVAYEGRNTAEALLRARQSTAAYYSLNVCDSTTAIDLNCVLEKNAPIKYKTVEYFRGMRVCVCGGG